MENTTDNLTEETTQTPEQETLNAENKETTAEQPNENTNQEPEPAKNKGEKHHHKHGNVGDAIEEKLQQLGEKLAEKEDQYKRLYADFENHRKRTNTEKADLILNGGKDVIKALLPVVDDLERALQNMGEDNVATEGIQLIYNKMMKTLEQKGLKPMDSMGQTFDENYHEAVTRIPATDESQKGTIIDVVEKGYFLNDRVLRFAKVVVAF